MRGRMAAAPRLSTKVGYGNDLGSQVETDRFTRSVSLSSDVMAKGHARGSRRMGRLPGGRGC